MEKAIGTALEMSPRNIPVRKNGVSYGNTMPQALYATPALSTEVMLS